MAKTTTKKWKLRVDGKTWTCISAEMELSDNASTGGYNHPYLILEFRLDGYQAEYEGDNAGKKKVWVKFQRHLIKNDRMDPRPAEYQMDTAKCWTKAYAGTVELEHDDQSFPLADRDFRLSTGSKLSIAAARVIAKTIGEYNINRVTEDDAHQAVMAVEKLGVYVEWLYLPTYYSSRAERVNIWNAKDMRANARAARKAKRMADPNECRLCVEADEDVCTHGHRVVADSDS